MKRVRLGLRRSAQVGIGMALFVGLAVTLFGKPVLSLFIRDEKEIAEQVLSIGYDYLRIMASGLVMLYLLFVYRSTLQGLGDTFIPMASGFMELAMRIGAAFLLPMVIGVWGVYLAEIAAWAGAGILLIIGCYYRLHQIRKKQEKQNIPVSCT